MPLATCSAPRVGTPRCPGAAARRTRVGAPLAARRAASWMVTVSGKKPPSGGLRALPGTETPWSPSGDDMEAVIDELTARAAAAAFFGEGDGDARVFIGIAGSPGSGKSTLATAVCERLNAAANDDVAVVFPMDGFHYYRAQLAEFDDPEEARRRRGAPFTFDAEAFVDRVAAAKTNADAVTLVPAFDHEVHDPEEDAIAIKPSHKVILVEGNYLLLPDDPWAKLHAAGADGSAPLLTETWFVDTSVDEAMERVMRRHVAVGRTSEEARARADGNDRPNGELVWANRHVAEVIVPSYDWDGAATAGKAPAKDEATKKPKTPYPAPESYVEHEIEGYDTTYYVLRRRENRGRGADGKAPVVCAEDIVTVHATGTVEETGTTFWSTRDEGERPFTYQAGVGGVITGWDRGCLGMGFGELRKIRIPAKEGYGEGGFPAWGIPAGATLVFEIEVLDIHGK